MTNALFTLASEPATTIPASSRGNSEHIGSSFECVRDNISRWELELEDKCGLAFFCYESNIAKRRREVHHMNATRRLIERTYVSPRSYELKRTTSSIIFWVHIEECQCAHTASVWVFGNRADVLDPYTGAVV